jgi:UDP-galactopyranose mutase
MTVDYLVVGSGLTGATIARLLADAGREVLVVESRSHVGGNVHDHTHPSGIRIHTYGPHYFRTNSDRIWAFVNRFANFYRYDAVLMTDVDGRLEPWPITEEVLRRFGGREWCPGVLGEARTFEEACLKKMPRLVYEKFVKGYTETQWGASARTLSASLASRFEVRANGDGRLKLDKYQGIPNGGYADFMKSLLKGIHVNLEFDYFANREAVRARKLLVYTGAIDQCFDYSLGHLAYRGQRRTHEYYPKATFLQPCGQINNPDPRQGPHIRTLEWKHMMPHHGSSSISGTVLTREVPFSPTNPDQYEYPFPDPGNAALYQRYRTMADGLPGLLVCGRLGEYRYYDMDQAIGRALMLGADVLRKHE